ncbi:hypothetical protein PMI01_00784, partial [Caulobacter sp. AP07]
MSTKVLRSILIAGMAVSALSLAACGKKAETAADASAQKAQEAAASASTATDAA